MGGKSNSCLDCLLECYVGTTLQALQSFAQLSAFSCLQASNDSYCMAEIAPLLEIIKHPEYIGEGSGNPAPTIAQCLLAQKAGCCFPSFLAYSFAAVQAGFIDPPQLIDIHLFRSYCAEHGISIALTPCNGTVPGQCEPILDSLSLDCFNYMMQIDASLIDIATNEQNAAFCENPCYENVTQAMLALIDNGAACPIIPPIGTHALADCPLSFGPSAAVSVALDASWFDCQESAPGNYCLASTVAFFDTVTNLTIGTCSAASDLGCCLPSLGVIEFTLYVNGYIAKPVADNLGSLAGYCKQYPNITISAEACGGTWVQITVLNPS